MREALEWLASLDSKICILPEERRLCEIVKERARNALAESTRDAEQFDQFDFPLVCRKFLIAWFFVGWFLFGWFLSSIALGQPKQAGPLGIPPRIEESELGRELFFATILSADGTISCASCHDPNKGWSDGRPVAVGIRGQVGTRNTPTLINTGYTKPMTFWDGRAVETTDQSVLPIQNPIEMGSQSIEAVLGRLRRDGKYLAAFASVFGVDQRTGSPITAANLARSLASFEATLNSFNAPIDKYLAGDMSALTAEQKIGFDLCKAANCFDCHPAPLFTDNECHNIGVEFATRGQIVDRGRAIVTGRTADIGSFKTPTLRSIGQSAPYMHNGRFADLERVVTHFNTGAYIGPRQGGRPVRDSQTDGRIRSLQWTVEQQKYVVEFLRTAFEGADYPLIGAGP